MKTCRALISCLLATLLLSACGSGGDGGEGGDSDFARIDEAILIVTSNGLHAVKLICTWGRTAAEERLIRRGCDAVLRTLQVE